MTLRISAVSLSLVSLCMGVCPLLAQPAYAATVRGTLRLPKRFNASAKDKGIVFWSIPNAVTPITKPLVDQRQRMVVTLESVDKAIKPTKPPKTTVEMSNSRFNPPVLAVPPGTRVTFVNQDHVLHLLEPITGAFMPARSVSHGDFFSHVFDKAGTFPIRCSEIPHMRITVLVTKHPYVVLPNADGMFRFENVEPGDYTLRLWYDGSWIHSQPLTVRGKTSVEVRPARRHPKDKK